MAALSRESHRRFLRSSVLRTRAEPAQRTRHESGGTALKRYRPWLQDIGKGTWAAIPLDQPIPMIASGVVGIIIIGILIWITLKGWLPYLWREWITSVDHKRIGIMYTLLAMVMLLRGFSDAIMMRSQQALAFQSRATCRPSTTTRSSRPTAR